MPNVLGFKIIIELTHFLDEYLTRLVMIPIVVLNFFVVKCLASVVL